MRATYHTAGEERVTADILNAELHCHNTFSNHRNGSPRMPFDCGVEMADQLDRALAGGIQVMFVTNHNTLDGYRQICVMRDSREKFKSLKVYPAEEITIDTGGHVLAYGIHTEIRQGMTLDETLDEIRRQGAVSCAAHPFAVTNGIRENASRCDLIESFNSNNVDRYSNIVAARFAKENGMAETAGSDSHVLGTIGRCINAVEAENNLDSILQAMRKGTVSAATKDYASRDELFEHAHYIVSSSRTLLLEYARQNHPSYHGLVRWALDSYMHNPNGTLWRSLAAFGLYLAARVSQKVNMKGHNPRVFENRRWSQLISMGLSP